MPPIHRRACLQGAGAFCLASLGVAPVLAQTPPASAKRKLALSPELQELVHMLDALEARFHERMMAAE